MAQLHLQQGAYIVVFDGRASMRHLYKHSKITGIVKWQKLIPTTEAIKYSRTSLCKKVLGNFFTRKLLIQAM